MCTLAPESSLVVDMICHVENSKFLVPTVRLAGNSATASRLVGFWLATFPKVPIWQPCWGHIGKRHFPSITDMCVRSYSYDKMRGAVDQTVHYVGGRFALICLGTSVLFNEFAVAFCAKMVGKYSIYHVTDLSEQP